jgi:hypothetical protein
MIFVSLALLALVAAQLDTDQYTAVRALIAGLGCTPPRCPDFAANESCPGSILACMSGRVTNITIFSGLTGSINGPALGALTSLTSLQLDRHNLTTIPTQIGRLVALTTLNLRSSALTGTVPSEFGTLSSLISLVMDGNKLTGTLPVLDKLTRLTNVDVGSNRALGGNMPAMPPSIAQLNLVDCAFTALPPNLTALTALRGLHVNNNKLSGVPPVIPASVTRCSLQVGNTDTNCFDCPSSGTFFPCTCVPNSNVTACPSMPTTTMASSTTSSAMAPSVTPTPVQTSTTTVETTAATTTVDSTLSTLLSTPTIFSGTQTTTATASALLSITAAALSSGGPEPWVVGVIIGGVVLALVLVGLVVLFLLKRRRAQQPTADGNAAELKKQSPHSEYGQLGLNPAPVYEDVADVQAPAQTYADVSDVRGVAANVYDIVKVSPPSEYDARDATLKT